MGGGLAGREQFPEKRTGPGPGQQPHEACLILPDQMSVALQELKTHRYLVASLQPKEQLYVDARVQGMMPLAAARAAGFTDPPKAVERLEQSHVVRAAIEYALRLRARETQITRQDVVEMIRDGMRVATDGMTIIAGAREIGKLLGHYAPQQIQVDKRVQVTREALSTMSDAEIAKLAALDAEYTILEEGERNDPEDDGPGAGDHSAPGD